MKHKKMSVKEYQEKMKSIVSEVLDLQDEEGIQNWFTGISRVSVFGKKYSPSNLLLVFQQKSTALWTEGPKTWNKLHCFWNPKFRIDIFAPAAFGIKCDECRRTNFKAKNVTSCRHCGQPLDQTKTIPMGFKLIPVFDIEDVEVKERGEKTKKIQTIRELQSKMREKVEQYATDRGDLSDMQLSAYAAALIRYIENQGVKVVGKPLNGSGARAYPGNIEYDESLTMGKNFGPLAHEWGHLCLHYGEDRKTLEKQQKELEAEMFSALILSGVGADIRFSAAYLLNWSKNANKEKREVLFIRAFHRVYHKAVDTLRCLLSETDPQLAELFSRMDEIEVEGKARWQNKEAVSKEKTPIKAEAGKTDTGSPIESVTVSRPGKLGRSTTPDLVGASKTLVADSAKYPGDKVKIEVQLNTGNLVSGAMLLDPKFLTAQYLLGNASGAHPDWKAKQPVLLLPAPEVKTDISTEKTPVEKVSVAEIDLRINDFKQTVYSFSDANSIIKQLAEKAPEGLTEAPRVWFTLIFDDDVEYQGKFRLTSKLKDQKDILQVETRRHCDFLTGNMPQFLSKDVYESILSGHSENERSLAKTILNCYSLSDFNEASKGKQMDLFDTLFGPNYNPHHNEWALTDEDFDRALSHRTPLAVKSKKKRAKVFWNFEGVDESILSSSGNEPLKEAAGILEMDDDKLPSIHFPVSEDGGFDIDKFVGPDGDPIALDF